MLVITASASMILQARFQDQADALEFFRVESEDDIDISYNRSIRTLRRSRDLTKLNFAESQDICPTQQEQDRLLPLVIEAWKYHRAEDWAAGFDMYCQIEKVHRNPTTTGIDVQGLSLEESDNHNDNNPKTRLLSLK